MRKETEPLIAETYLERIKKIDAIIVNKMRDYKRWKDIAEGMGGFSVGERVQSSRNLQRGSNAIIEYISIEEEIEALKEERKAIIQTMEQLPIPEYSILFKIYVEGCTLKEVAYSFGNSYDWAKKKKRKALNMVQKFLDSP